MLIQQFQIQTLLLLLLIQEFANPNYVANNSGKKNVELAIPLKYLGNFWRALNMPLITCEVSLELK